MKAVDTTLKLENTDDIKATMTISMTVGDWKSLLHQVKPAVWPGLKIRKHIDRMLERVIERVESEHDLDERI